MPVSTIHEAKTNLFRLVQKANRQVFFQAVTKTILTVC
jgi:hypothetical protein